MDAGGNISCHVEDINVATIEVTQGREVEFREKFNIPFPNLKGQCLNTKDFELLKDKLIAEIENSLNPSRVIKNFLDNYSDIINGSQSKHLLEIVNSS